MRVVERDDDGTAFELGRHEVFPGEPYLNTHARAVGARPCEEPVGFVGKRYAAELTQERRHAVAFVRWDTPRNASADALASDFAAFSVLDAEEVCGGSSDYTERERAVRRAPRPEEDGWCREIFFEESHELSSNPGLSDTERAGHYDRVGPPVEETREVKLVEPQRFVFASEEWRRAAEAQRWWPSAT